MLLNTKNFRPVVKIIEKLLNQYCITKIELKSYVKFFMLSIPVYFYFILKLFEQNIPGFLIGILGFYTIISGIYLFFTSYKNIQESLPIA
jgi:hypothetical protein